MAVDYISDSEWGIFIWGLLYFLTAIASLVVLFLLLSAIKKFDAKEIRTCVVANLTLLILSMVFTWGITYYDYTTKGGKLGPWALGWVVGWVFILVWVWYVFKFVDLGTGLLL